LSDFLKKKEFISKCQNCPLKDKNKVECKQDNFILYEEGRKDILVIHDSPEKDPEYLFKFVRYLKLKGIQNFAVTTGIQCRGIAGELPSPQYAIYKTCNWIAEDKIKEYKVIVTTGRAVYAITKSDDIIGWMEFNELLFNQTYFYTPFNWNKKLRVYPLPGLYDWLLKDNFNKFFVNKQLEFIQDHLKNYEEFILPPFTKTVISDSNEFLKQHMSKTLCSWDTETSGLVQFNKDFKIGCITITFDGKEGYYVPYDSCNKRLLEKFFSNKYQILANGKYDVTGLYVKDQLTTCKVDEDITLLFHVLNTERRLNSIKSLAWLIGFGGYDSKLEEYKIKYRVENYLKIPEHILAEYSTLDAIVTHRLYDLGMKLKEKQPRVYEAYKKYLIRVIPVFMKMEIEGIELDFDKLKKLNDELIEKIKDVEEQIYIKLNKRFDINSNQKLARIFEEMGFPSFGKSTKMFYLDEKNERHYYYKVGEKELVKWKNLGYEIPDLILKHRELCKLVNAFVGSYAGEKDQNIFSRTDTPDDSDSGLIKFIRDDNKLHSIFNPGRTDTLRTSCHSPNLQQMIKHGEYAEKLRELFKAPEGYVWTEADESGFQLRIAAIYSGDENMKDIFLNRGGDMHSFSAANIFCKGMSIEDFLKVKNEEPYKTYRWKAKNQINFPLLFSSSPYVIYPTIENNWTKDEISNYLVENNLTPIVDQQGNIDKVITVCTDLRNKFFETYHGLAKWIKNQHTIAQEQGYVDSYHGGRRHLPQLLYLGKDVDKKELKGLMNISVNSIVQTFEAFVIYESMISIDEDITQNKLKSKMVMMIHDALVFLNRKDEIKSVYYDLIKKNMDYTCYSIPIEGEMSVGEIWGFGKEVNSKNIEDFIKKYK